MSLLGVRVIELVLVDTNLLVVRVTELVLADMSLLGAPAIDLVGGIWRREEGVIEVRENGRRWLRGGRGLLTDDVRGYY
jgi:hypothetical protein